MPIVDKLYDVVVVGAGVGGICAAIAAARTGARTLLVEKENEIGGTGIHSPVSLVCKFHGTDHRPINLGIHRDLFPEIYLHSTRDHRPEALRLTYDEKLLLKRYKELISRERLLELWTGVSVVDVEFNNRHLQRLSFSNGKAVGGLVFVDGTADGNLSAMAGCRYEKGRKQDGAMQSATLVFGMGSIMKDKLRIHEFSTRRGLSNLWGELTPLFREMKAACGTSNARHSVLAFPYPDGDRLLFNSTAVLGVDPTDETSVANAMIEGRKQIEELVGAIRQHPAFHQSTLEFVATKLGIREGRRVIGDYQLTEEDCLGEARFEDMVAACAYELDIHDPKGGKTRMVDIPGSGYYHIPYRCLIAADADNLLLGSRCISGTHEAHSSYRVMSGVSAIGQAAGTAAALAANLKQGRVREIQASWVRHVLREQVQFVEGSTQHPPNWSSYVC